MKYINTIALTLLHIFGALSWLSLFGVIELPLWVSPVMVATFVVVAVIWLRQRRAERLRGDA